MTEHTHDEPGLGLALRGSLAAALAFGVAEAANAIRRHRLDHLPTGGYVAGEVFWMAPVAAVFGLGLVAALYLGLRPVLPRRFAPTQAVLGITVSLGAFGLLTAMSIGLSWWSAGILAIGLGVVVQRAFARWPAAMGRLSSVGIVIGTTIALGATVLPAWMRTREERATYAALPPATENAPNILVLIWDTARAQNMSLYGYPRQTTPVLDSLAAHGLVFDRAFATSPWSLPSHASIFTGHYPHELTAGPRIPLDRTQLTLAEHFASKGYATAAMTANLFYGSPDYGIDRGFSRYDARPPINWRSIAHTWILSRRVALLTRQALGNHDTLLRRRAEHVNSSFLSWMDTHEGRPFLAVLNYFDAHEPYRAPAPYDTKFAALGARYWADETLNAADSSVLRQLRDMYDGGIAYDDFALGQLLQSLRERGQLDRTIVIVTSDHGEEFGERGPTLLGHNRSLYRQALHVPMVIVGPSRGVPVGRSSAAVSIRDIPTTLSQLSFPSEPSRFPGRSLVDAARDTSSTSPPVLAMTEKHRWARTGTEGWPTSWGSLFSALSVTHQYLVDGRGEEGLYDLLHDPFDGTNLAPDSTQRLALSQLRRALDAGVGPPATRVARRGARPPKPPAP
ncbi:MAG: sulfatase-like hydrolase/transferase [Gemmatimonadetes bacterium]|nr:sulfatase-like hydrolase/transferase [Gemmatimonadota bacterium]